MSARLGVTAANGGNAQPARATARHVENDRILVQLLQQASVFLASGVSVIDSPGGVPVRVPKQAPPLTRPKPHASDRGCGSRIRSATSHLNRNAPPS